MAENDTNHKRKCVILLFAILHIFDLLSRKFKLLLILNKQITSNCFVFIYNPIVYLSKKNHILLFHFVVYLRRIDIMNAGNNLPLLKVLLGV